MKISIIFSTHNRAHYLQGTLESLCRLLPPKCEWKVIVVNNASTDNTNEVLEKFADRLPLSCIEEPERGKNRALNKALQFIDDGLVICTDDDVTFQRDWLLVYEEAFTRHGKYSVFGGTVLPDWSQTPPFYIWNLDSTIRGAAYSLTEYWWREGSIIADYIYGPNMAIRSAIFKEEGYRFNESIGPDGSDYAQGSEVELTKRLEADGHRCWHLKEAIVYHKINTNQLSLQWLYRRAVRYGRGQEKIACANSERSDLETFLNRLSLDLQRILLGVLRIILFPLGRSRYQHLFVELKWKYYVVLGALRANRISGSE